MRSDRSLEAARLDALRSYDVLDTEAEPAFDDLTRLAAHICRVPIALVSLVDDRRQWFKSRVGLDARETPRDIAFCSHAIDHDEVMVVPDALADGRFAANPLVVTDPHIRFYAGAPLIVAAGIRIGTLCAIDRTPRSLAPDQREALAVLARQVVAQLELRRQVQVLSVMQGELAEQEEIARLRTEHSHDFILELTPDARILYTNPRVCIALGRDASTLVGQNVLDVLHPEDRERLATDHARVVRGEPTTPIEGRFRRADGTWCWVEVMGRPFRMRGEIRVVAIARDISARKQLERHRSDFVAMLAHDVRQPVSGIALGVECLRDTAGLPDEARSLLEPIGRCATTLCTLVTNYLDASRLEAGAVALRKVAVDLGTIVTQAIASCTATAREGGVELGAHMPETPVVLHGDAAALERILTNLIGNAVKFTPAGGRVVIALGATEESVSIDVIDTGPGIPRDALPTIFDRYVQSEDGLQKTKGVGLGLYIAHQLAVAHGGTLHVTSEVGRGTRFTVVLPAPAAAFRTIEPAPLQAEGY